MMTISDILKSDLSCGAKLIAIAMVNGARTAREAAEACSMNLRTAERHYADARILLRNIAYPPPQYCVPDTQNSVAASRAHKLSEENNKNPIIPKTNEPTTKPKRKRQPAALVEPERFDEFWNVYPRKVGKGQARNAWAKAVGKVADPQTIVDAAKAQANTLASKGEFCPHPSTWLNGERWSDEQINGRPKFSREQLEGKSRSEIVRMMGVH